MNDAISSNMDENPTIVAERIETGFITATAVLKYMEKFVHAEIVQQRGCEFLSQLEPEDTGRIRSEHIHIRLILRANSGEERVLSAMKRFPMNGNIQASGCKSIRFQARRGTNERLIELKGLTVVIAAMDNHLDREDVQVNASYALANLGFFGNHGAAIIRHNGLEAITRALDKYPYNPTVQSAGCSALWNTARLNDSKMRIAKSGAVDKVLRAMDYHLDSEGVQSAGCGIFWVLAMVREIRVILLRLDAVSRIVHAMDVHINSKNVQLRALGSLSEFAKEQPYCYTLKNLGIKSRIQNAFERYADNPSVRVFVVKLNEYLTLCS
mmetsp:Transcript_14209/g.17237  ORF Transcript_14209/g.17237 Transcript_14209/m.17237 type:complete len:325 (+) Transcript_14209:284-1258(+)|eukprot:CAMPEP_0184023288 /NCGR_PEP_ID=MMETSP0954-20121128/11274_1 /TAXON_ID=627963 /ORGANISM="Aplanochytrium sp, Strain PBS07" /LENGTH=324 /DNA_ID=CAMNT_0026306149 /DNA_START=179 /DNA_END=1153 /DNA_ORIENTATION=+